MKVQLLCFATSVLAAFLAPLGAAQPVITQASGLTAIRYPAPVEKRLYPEDFGAACDGVTDDSLALQDWLDAGSQGEPLGIGPYACLFTTPLVVDDPNGLSILGMSKQLSTLVYAGPDNVDIVTIGAETGEPARGVELRHFRMVSSTKMVDGAGLRLKRLYLTEVDIAMGRDGAPPNSNHNFHHGLWVDRSSFTNLNASQFYTSADGVRANNGVELRMGHSIIQGHFDLADRGGNAIHIGGGFGGLYTESVDEIYYSIGLLVDTSIDPTTGNNQIFIGPDSVFDSNVDAGVYFNDPLPSNKFAQVDGWFASTTNGNACVVQNWNAGIFASSAGKFVTSQGGGSGLVFLDPSLSRVQIGGGVVIANNTGYGVTSSTLLLIYSTCVPGPNNGLGDYNSYGTLIVTWKDRGL